MRLPKLTVGDRVVRLLAGTVRMELRVTSVSSEEVVCGWWTFDPETGAEIDPDLGWGPPPLSTGSYIVVDLSPVSATTDCTITGDNK